MIQKKITLKIYVCFAIGLILSLVCWYDLTRIIDILGKNVVKLFVFSVFFGGGAFCYTFPKLFREENKYIKILLLSILALYYSFSIISVNSLLYSRFNIFTVAFARDIVWTFIWVFPTLVSLYIGIASIKFLTGEYTDFRRKRIIAILAVLMITEFLFLIISLNPAITVQMTVGSLINSRELGEIPVKDWVSPFYFIFLKVLLCLMDTVTFIATLQYLFFIVIYLRVVSFLISKGVKIVWLVAMSVYIMLNVSLQMMLLTVMPDSFYLSFMLWLTFLIIRITDSKGEVFNNRFFLAEMIIVCSFIALLRQNGLLIALGCAVFLSFIYSRNYKKCLIIPTMLLMIIIVVKGPVYNYFRVEIQPQLKFLALTNDILNSYYSGAELDEETMNLVNDVTYGNPNQYNYTQFKALYAVKEYNQDGLKDYSIHQLLYIYLKNLIRNPKTVLTAFLCRTQQIWSVAHPAGAYTILLQPHNYRGDNDERINLARIPERKANGGTRFVEYIFDRTARVDKIIYKVFWRGSFLYNIILLMTMIFIIKDAMRKKEIYVQLLFLLPILLSVFSLLVGGGWPDYRYHVPAIAIMPLSVIYLMYIGILNKQKEIKKDIEQKCLRFN